MLEEENTALNYLYDEFCVSFEKRNSIIYQVYSVYISCRLLHRFFCVERMSFVFTRHLKPSLERHRFVKANGAGTFNINDFNTLENVTIKYYILCTKGGLYLLGLLGLFMHEWWPTHSCIDTCTMWVWLYVYKIYVNNNRKSIKF